jgi:hypothetical protein
VNEKERGSVRGKEKENGNGSVRENGKSHLLFQVPVLTLLQALSGNDPVVRLFGFDKKTFQIC